MSVHLTYFIYRSSTKHVYIVTAVLYVCDFILNNLLNLVLFVNYHAESQRSYTATGHQARLVRLHGLLTNVQVPQQKPNSFEMQCSLVLITRTLLISRLSH